MTSSMKGLLKGLRYIARIFEDEKEPEIQIGLPTDVKHVAHIGWEGPSATTPSWMHEFKSPDLSTDSKTNSNKKAGSSSEKQKTKGRRNKTTSTATANSPGDSPTKIGSTKQSRRSTGKQKEQGTDLPSDQTVGQKQSRQRKPKASAAGGGGESPSTGPVRTKEADITVRAVYPLADLGTSTGR